MQVRGAQLHNTGGVQVQAPENPRVASTPQGASVAGLRGRLESQRGWPGAAPAC